MIQLSSFISVFVVEYCKPGILKKIKKIGLVWFMVFNATFNNISVISWQSFLLVEKIGVP
jgi:hypothetical protein